MYTEVTNVCDCYDLILVGNAGRNEMHRFDGTREPIGGPIFQSALATSWSDKRVAVVTRIAAADDDLLEPLRRAGLAVFVVPSPETTRGHIYYLSEDVDNRRHVLEKSAGPFTVADLPAIGARLFHLVGHNRLEFPVEFMTGLRERGLAFSVDLQALVRRPDLLTGEVAYEDYPYKQEVAAIADKVKLDSVEAGLLTGTNDLEAAAIQFERWGTREVMVTSAAGALVRHRGKTYFERFTNRSVSGRTGRGDTVFASYLLRRFDCDVADSLKFAVALCSIKMETPGPFKGTLEDVVERMRADRR
jgi:sugar/nucleoside kinase (ribokinase family)